MTYLHIGTAIFLDIREAVLVSLATFLKFSLKKFAHHAPIHILPLLLEESENTTGHKPGVLLSHT